MLGPQRPWAHRLLGDSQKCVRGPHGPFWFLHLGQFHSCEDAIYWEHQSSHISTLGPLRIHCNAIWSLKILRPMSFRISWNSWEALGVHIYLATPYTTRRSPSSQLHFHVGFEVLAARVYPSMLYTSQQGSSEQRIWFLTVMRRGSHWDLKIRQVLYGH